MKVKILSALLCALVFPIILPAQAATAWVKAAPEYCWQDTKEYVKDHGRGFLADEAQHLLTGSFAQMRSSGGELSVAVRTLPEKNKKGEEGCTIVVEERGTAAAADFSRSANALNGSANTQLAGRIVAYVSAKEKAREKKEQKDKKQ